MRYFGYYLIIINFISLFMIKIDKIRAKKNLFRIPEKNFFILSLFGGSIGVLIGMYLFHHKTKKMKFYIGIPFLLLIQLFILYYLLKNGLISHI